MLDEKKARGDYSLAFLIREADAKRYA